MGKQRNRYADPVRYFTLRMGASLGELQRAVSALLDRHDDGELFLERRVSDALMWKDKRVDGISRSVEEGFGLRGVSGETIGYVSMNKLGLPELKSAEKVLREIPETKGLVAMPGSEFSTAYYYSSENYAPLALDERIMVAREIDAYARAIAGVANVGVTIAQELQVVCIIRPDGRVVEDVRPLARITISIQREKGGKYEWGSASFGGRAPIARYTDRECWVCQVNHADHEAAMKLEAGPCPAGKMSVVLGPGWPGVILHEAIGHPLEADAVRKGESVFKDRIGEFIASTKVTVVDDGTIPERRGSLSVDDEGTRTERTVLIDKGKLVSYMYDRQSARYYDVKSTGNGRREDYRSYPIVRMRNTFMLPGEDDPEEIICSTERGLYAPSMGRGQVDPITGKFVFESPVAYIIESGKVTRPVKGATLIGTADEVLLHVDMVGTDGELDPGTGTCGKEGQSVPVGVGQPTIRIMEKGVTVGGTDDEE